MESKSKNSGRTEVGGGYVLLRVPELLLAWWLCKEGHLELLDVRVHLACFELIKRRSFQKPGRVSEYRIEELQRLVGGRSKERVRASLSRLEAIGLLSWELHALTLARSPDQVRIDDLSGFWEMLGQVQNNRRAVPVPRRVLAYMVGGATRVTLATLLGHLLRCLYLRGQTLNPVGNCSAAYIEELFGVAQTSVHSARQRLVALGVFKEVATEQWHKNRYGARIEVNLTWGGPRHVAEEGNGKPGNELPSKSGPPVAVFSDTIATPYRENRHLPTEGKNQNLGGEGPKPPPGVSNREGKAPDLRHIDLQDLKDTKRMLLLHEQAHALGLAPGGERGQLEVLGLAEHALAYATKNPPGLFAQLLRRQLWFISQDDEESARRRLRELREGQEDLRVGGTTMVTDLFRPRIPVDTSSEQDAELARDQSFLWQLRRVLAAKGVRDDETIFLELSKAKPEWTRERWLRATLGVRRTG